jgi:hypothetical protein
MKIYCWNVVLLNGKKVWVLAEGETVDDAYAKALKDVTDGWTEAAQENNTWYVNEQPSMVLESGFGVRMLI